MEEDRISMLPDWLIIGEILTRLESTKEAIRTGILSKRWLHLWTFVPNLVFHIMIQDDDEGKDKVYSIVDQTLSQCASLSINKLHIFIQYHFHFEANVTSWIRYAVNRNVHEFHLIIPILPPHLSRFLLPQFFFSSSSFTLLQLDGCIFNPSAGSIAWKNLKSLSVARAKLDHDLIQDIFSGSPLLETLELEMCYGFTRLDIPSKSFKKLVFSGFFDRDDRYRCQPHYIEINAPYALSLTIDWRLALTKLSLLNVSSLIKAELDYYLYRGSTSQAVEMLTGLIHSLRHVKELTLGERCLKMLALLKAQGFTFPPNMIKYVESIEKTRTRRNYCRISM